MQGNKTDQVPERFVQEGWVHRGRAVDRHAPGQIRLAAVRLAVDEIAPAPNALADQQAERRKVTQAGKGQLFAPAVRKQAITTPITAP